MTSKQPKTLLALPDDPPSVLEPVPVGVFPFEVVGVLFPFVPGAFVVFGAFGVFPFNGTVGLESFSFAESDFFGLLTDPFFAFFGDLSDFFFGDLSDPFFTELSAWGSSCCFPGVAGLLSDPFFGDLSTTLPILPLTCFLGAFVRLLIDAVFLRCRDSTVLHRSIRSQRLLSDLLDNKRFILSLHYLMKIKQEIMKLLTKSCIEK